ncbi:MAG: hypothetical protein ACK50J_00015 [Planctomyces sp.]
MVSMNEFGRKTVRKIDLRLAEREGTLSDPDSRKGPSRLMRHCLSAITGKIDDNLLERMIHLGFNPENLGAIHYAPIAEVAWANGRVTQFEQVFAISAALSSDLLQSPPAFDLFQSWLAERPHKALWSLWEDYMTDRLAISRSASDEQFGQRLYETASRVALASGGLLDLGEICIAEQRVLDRIARVYNLQVPL